MACRDKAGTTLYVRVMIQMKRLSLASLLALALLAPALRAPARADEMPRVSILEENDSLYFNSDKHYTQGLRLSYLAPDLAKDGFWNGWFDFAARIPWVFVPDGDGTKRRYAPLLGPEHLHAEEPDLEDAQRA